MGQGRLKIVMFSYGVDICEVVVAMRQLPRDAKFLAALYNYAGRYTAFTFSSMEWDEVPDNVTPPELFLVIRNDDVKAERERSDVSPAQIRKAANAATDYGVGPISAEMLMAARSMPQQNDYGELEARMLALCKCDLAYTGMRTHKQGCPLKLK